VVFPEAIEPRRVLTVAAGSGGGGDSAGSL
jgi:hypothetical protein